MSADDTCTSGRILLHIGYHKTATTWFQSELFPRPELGFQLLSARNLVQQALCIPHPLADAGNEAARRMVAEAQDATARGRYFVISHERLSGYPASGGYDSRMLADRLKSHFPNARIFCLFREQRAMILSAWRQQVVDGGGLSLRHFIDPPEPDVRRVPLFDPAMYRYSRLLEHYRGLFGADHVLFRPYEAFCAQPALVLAGLAELLENRALGQSAAALATGMQMPNPSLSMPLLHLQRFLNRHLVRSQLSQQCLIDVGSRPVRAAIRVIDRAFGGILPRRADSRGRRRALRTIEQRCGAFFDEDNALLSRLTGMKLSDFGYSVSRQAA